jgi:hypothetical protein
MQQWHNPSNTQPDTKSEIDQTQRPSELRQWPVQLTLVPPDAPYFKDADLLVAADCIPFAYNNFHEDFLRGRAIVVGCPKLDDLNSYVEKLTEIFKVNNLRSVEVVIMEVPCCGGLAQAVEAALYKAGSQTPLKITVIGVRGEHFGSRDV